MLSRASTNTHPAVEPDAGQLLATCLLRQLEAIAPMPPQLRQLLERSVLRLLDSAMLIDDPLLPFPPLPAQINSIPLPEVPHLTGLESVIDDIAHDGLAAHFLPLMSGIGKTLTWLHGTPEQCAQMLSWSDAGLRAGFFLTDRGGPSMQKDWRSVYEVEADGARLVVDKMWGISALDCGFAMVAARQAGRLSPVLLMVPPDVTAQLSRSAVGQPYLDGTLQLGNLAGTLTLPPGCVLQKGGPMGVKQYMSLVRPRFVRALCAHIEWLANKERLALSHQHATMLDYIKATARFMCEQRQFSRYSEDAVMALKFAVNELMLQLVEQQLVNSRKDQRDLLAFSKMEGSSYRCYYEIYTRSKGARHVG